MLAGIKISVYFTLYNFTRNNPQLIYFSCCKNKEKDVDKINKMLSRDAKNSATFEPIDPQLTNTSSRV